MKRLICIVFIAGLAAVTGYAQNSYTVTDPYTGRKVVVKENITRSFKSESWGVIASVPGYRITVTGSGWTWPVELHTPDGKVYQMIRGSHTELNLAEFNKCYLVECAVFLLLWGDIYPGFSSSRHHQELPA